MEFLYDLGYYIGYFFIMIACMVIAIITAKHKFSWGIYAFGALVQLTTLIGDQKTAKFYGMSMTIHWVMYLVLLAISAMIIVDRYEKLMRK